MVVCMRLSRSLSIKSQPPAATSGFLPGQTAKWVTMQLRELLAAE
jgi:hypothetical protein